MKVLLHKGYLYWECPAQNCGLVRIPVEGDRKWTWNGNLDKPTLAPSVRITWDFGVAPNRVSNCCHFNVTDGQIVFHDDCTHELKGKTLAMPDLTEDVLRFMSDGL